MKVLFVITVWGHGKGGHSHSLNHISRHIAEKLEVKIISIGMGDSAVIKNNPYFMGHLAFDGLKITSFRRGIRKVLSDFQPEILHFFEDHSYNVITPFLKKNKYSLVVNRCGGPNPADYPKVENLVLFSKENLKWFKERKKFDRTNIRLIPNRVKSINVDTGQHIEKDKSSFCFMRIARIGRSYLKSFKDAVNLLEKLRKLTQNSVKLYIIGTIEDEMVYNELESLIGNDSDVTILTENQFTNEASKMLYLADAVIATGRGIMEASSLGLPVLTPAMNSDTPLLVSERNFDNFFGTNFSQRNVADEIDLKENLGNITKLLTDTEFYSETSNISLKLFEENFDVSKAYEKYHELYTVARSENRRVSKFSDFRLKIRSCYYFYLRSK